jgi:3',5'-cyclic AMP phosphodiesterase CpdA
MNVFRVIQISDTHLSREKAWFAPNFAAVTRIVSAEAPDLVVNTGDIALDGVAREDDLAFARACHDTLDVPVRTIPGNHDVGDNPWRQHDTVITDERLSRYRRHFGDDFWIVDAGLWLLVGLDAQLLGSGLPAEEEQWTVLASVTARAGGRPVALFIHKPLFDRHPDEIDVNQRYVTPDNRHRLTDGLRGADLRLVASGHVHQHRRHHVGGVEHCWAPSTAYVLPDRRQPRIGVKRVGYVDYRFHEAGVDATVVEAPELTNHDLDEFPLAYAH